MPLIIWLYNKIDIYYIFVYNNRCILFNKKKVLNCMTNLTSYNNFGDLIRHIRVDILRQNLRDFCRALGFDTSEWSCIERNLKQISQEQTDKIFDYLIKETGDQYFESSETGLKLRELSKIKIEEKQYNTDEEVLGILPAFLCVSTSEVDSNKNKPTTEQLNILFESLKRNW